MRKILVILFLISSTSIPAFAWSPFKGMIEAKVADEINGVKQEFNGRVSGIEKLCVDLQVKVDAVAQGNANAVMALKSDIKNTNNVIKGNQSNVTNDSGLMWKIIYGLLTIITVLIGNQFFVLKKLLKCTLEKKFYKEQTILKVKDVGELKDIREKHNKFIKEGKL